MDLLRAQILICHIGVRRELARLKSERVMTVAVNVPSALTMREKIQGIRAVHARSLAALDAKLDSELKVVAAEAARTVSDLDAKLQGDVNAHKDEIRALRDELNQMTNGGPPLSDSDDSSKSSETSKNLVVVADVATGAAVAPAAANEPAASWGGGAAKTEG